MTLGEVMKEARENPKDLLQYDLIEIKPGEANSSKSNHLMRAGYKQQKLKNYQQAREHFSKAIVAEKYNLGAWFCRGVANDKCGDFLKAASDFSFVLKTQLAMIQQVAAKKAMIENENAGKKKTSKTSKVSKETFENIDDLDELDNQTSRSKPRVNAKGEPITKPDKSENTGINNMETNIKMTISRVFFNRAMVYIHLGNDDDAVDDLSNALKRNPKEKVCRGARAMVYRRIGEYAKSQGDYTFLSKMRETERKAKETEFKLVTGATPLAPKSQGRMKSVHMSFDPSTNKVANTPKLKVAHKKLNIDDAAGDKTPRPA